MTAPREAPPHASRQSPQSAHAAPSPTQAGAERRQMPRPLSKKRDAAPPRVRDARRPAMESRRLRPGAARRSSFPVDLALPAPLCPGLCGLRARVALFAFACVLALVVPGCATEPNAPPPTFSTWQHNLEQYVWDRGNGDPNVLADMSWDDVHKGFAVIGDALPDRSTDEIGLLLAHRMLDGKPWFLFLVGTVRHQILEDLRPVALNVEGSDFHWSVGASDERSLSLYRAWSEADRSRTEPPDPNAPPFPRPQETFDVTVRRDAFIVRHEDSGAEWELRPIVKPKPTTEPAESTERTTGKY
jgi:ribosomal protein S30